MALASANLQALIKAIATLNCEDSFPLKSVPLNRPQIAGFRLLGLIISLNPPSLATVCDFLHQAWKFASPFSVDILPGDRFPFTVSAKDLVAKIMENGPWNVKGALMVVKPWPPELTIDEVDLSSYAFWVQVHGLSFQNLTVVNVIKIGKFIGIEVLNVENGDLEEIIANHHLRIRIMMCYSLSTRGSFFLIWIFPLSGFVSSMRGWLITVFIMG